MNNVTLDNFVTCRKNSNQCGGCISALGHCRKITFRKYLHLTLISLFLCCNGLVISINGKCIKNMGV